MLSRLRAEKLFIKKTKCFFAQKEIEFCRFLVETEGVHTHPDKNKQIAELPTPTNAKDIRSFLGLAGFYQRFVKNFAQIVVPLTNMLIKDTKFDWSPAAAKAFQDIRDCIAQTARLAFPDLNRELHLHIDASNAALGATLSEENKRGEMQLLICTSRKLNPAEKNYPAHEREFLGLVHALKKWKNYLQGSNVVAHTNNMALKYWKTAQK